MTVLGVQVEVLDKKLDGFSLFNQAPLMSCETCGRGHLIQDWQNRFGSSRQMERVDYWGNANSPKSNPFSSAYNAAWWNHPNFGWSN